ncbi:MAG: hypothetical protein RLZZ58_1938 [Pseudomonadota bacterium]
MTNGAHILRGSVAALALATALTATAASAQALPAAPTREEILRDQPAPAIGPAAEAVSTDDTVERSPCPLANPEFADIKLTLRSVEFSGSAAIDTASLAPTYADFIGREVPVAVVCEIRDRAATQLRAAGYLAAVRVPEQTITDGVLRLEIRAATLTRIQVRGDAGASEAVLARYLRKLEGQPVFNIRDAERYLLLARDIPGIEAKLVLRPGGAPGEVIGEVTVAQVPVQFDANVQNFGTKEVGRFGGIVRARFNGLTGMGDQTSLSVYSTADFREQQVVQAGHEFRVGGEGLRLGGTVTYAWTKPDIVTLPIKSETLVANFFASYPLVRRQAQNLIATAGFDLVNQDIDLGPTPLNRDRLRVVSARIDANWIDPASFTGRSGFSPAEPRWSLATSFEARQGVGILGGSKDCGPTFNACFIGGRVPISRVEADTTALVLRLSGNAEFRPTSQVAFSLAPRVQWSPDALLAYEEFSAGNFTVGRGYDPGVLIGDSGVGAAFEMRVGSLIPKDRHSFAIQPFAFADGAYVWNKDSSFAGLDPQKLFAVGGGARIAFGDAARLDLALAVPLRKAGLQTEKGDVRLLISLTTQFAAGRR